MRRAPAPSSARQPDDFRRDGRATVVGSLRRTGVRLTRLLGIAPVSTKITPGCSPPGRALAAFAGPLFECSQAAFGVLGFEGHDHGSEDEGAGRGAGDVREAAEDASGCALRA